MNTSAIVRDPRVMDVHVVDASLIVSLRDGREIKTPLSWFPRLESASAEQRARWEPAAAGHGIHWPLIDEDLSIEGLLQGQSAPINAVYLNKPQSTPPRFTRYIGSQPGRRMAIVRGQDSGRWTDIYHQVLTVSWGVFLIGLAALFIGLNVIFALLYMVDPHALTNVPADDFRDAFIFSVATFGVQTITGASHVSMTANDGYAAIIVMIEAFTGILYLGMVTAIMFARFSRPFARILFSKVAIIANFDGVPTLMFRAANQRGNRILDAAISVSLAHESTSKEGLVMRRFDELTLMRARSPLFALSWTIMHRIDDNSPLRGMDFKAMCEQEFEILILLSGTDETLADIIYARHSYVPADFRWNHRFVDVLSIAPSGHRIVDLTKFHDTEPLGEH